MKFSIIVPVYNSECYLKECIDSTLTQSYSDFELILVDDGSIDASGIICDEYAELDSRIKVFHKENGGVSSTRNLGLDNASGDWIVFLDADDTLHKCALECIKNEIDLNSDVDIIQFSFTRTPFQGDKIKQNNDYLSGLTPETYCKSEIYNVCVGGSAIRRDIIDTNNLRFDCRLKLAEDQVFIFQIFQNSRLCSKMPHILYYYRDNLSSATKTAKLEYILNTIRILGQYKREIPLAVEQFDNVIMSFIYYTVLDIDVPECMIVNLLAEVDVKKVSRCSRGVRFMYYLSKVSKKLAITLTRKLKVGCFN